MVRAIPAQSGFKKHLCSFLFLFFFPPSRLRCIVNMAFYCCGCRLCACLCSQCLTLHFSPLNVNYIAMPLFCVCFTMHAMPARSCLLTLHSKCQHCSQVCRELFSKVPQARCGQVSGLHSILESAVM